MNQNKANRERNVWHNRDRLQHGQRDKTDENKVKS